MKKVNFNKTYRSKLERSLDEVIHTNEKNHREVEVQKISNQFKTEVPTEKDQAEVKKTLRT